MISGVGDDEYEIKAIRDWCASLGEVRSMVKVVKSPSTSTSASATVREEEGEEGQGSMAGWNVWIVDFKKSSVAESVSTPIRNCEGSDGLMFLFVGLSVTGNGGDQGRG